MAAEVVMPKLGMAMKEGTVSTWNKKVGDSVSKGDMIASINSEKIEMEIEAPQDGVILDILVQEDV
ncbi:branched-chain alpha-keto acid dehydrogenase subunit E2, partial [Priestia megaterium]